MKSFRDILKIAEPEKGIPIMVEGFDQWGEDIRKYAELIWPELAAGALMDLATKLYIDTDSRSPIERKMYLALQRRYNRYFANYPDTTALLIGEKLSTISRFLTSHSQKAVYHEGDVDFEIDFLLYLDCFLTEPTR